MKTKKEIKSVEELSLTETRNIYGGGRYEIRLINGIIKIVYLEDKK